MLIEQHIQSGEDCYRNEVAVFRMEVEIMLKTEKENTSEQIKSDNHAHWFV
jgi:hypothetical protein